MSAPCSGISRLPSLARIASGRRGDAVAASGKSSRKSAILSTSEWPIARNFSGARSEGADRFVSGSKTFIDLGLGPFATLATLDFGKSPPHFGSQKNIIETGRNPARLSRIQARFVEASFVQSAERNENP